MAYNVVRRLGRGGMGVVDLGQDGDGRQVALKRLPLHGSAAEIDQARRRIRREADVLRALSHPAIVDLLDVLDGGDEVVLVMPFLAGGTLGERVTMHGPLPADDVIRIGARLLDALAAAHREGVVHRDVKPANVLFDSAGDAYLADFGVASSRDATVGLTATEMVLGTPAFMSPEQARGEQATASSDVFSLGATLLFALTGTGPYGDGDARALVHRAAAGRVARVPPGTPPALRRALTAMLRRDSTRRPSAAALLGGPAGTAVRTLRGPVSRRVRVGGAVALALVLVAAAALALRANDGDPAAAAPATTLPTSPPCQDLPYQPCGQPAAPGTDGQQCIDDRADYDTDAVNGCEAIPDTVDGTRLTRGIEANLVPADDVDEYPIAVEDHLQLFCDGTLAVTLIAPPGVAQRVEVVDGDKVLGATGSTDGFAARLEINEPSCWSDDGGTLVVRVLSIGADRSGDAYRIQVTGSF